MTVTVESYGQAIVLHYKGELTVDSLEAFKKAVDHHLQEEHVRDVVLDFEAAPFVDSAAFEYLLDLQDLLNERMGQIKLAGLDENLAKILEITRLDSAFQRFENVSEAVNTM